MRSSRVVKFLGERGGAGVQREYLYDTFNRRCNSEGFTDVLIIHQRQLHYEPIFNMLLYN